MEPGNELDSKVATLVFKYAVLTGSKPGFFLYNHNTKTETLLPSYSTNLDDAYKVLDHMVKNNYLYKMGSKTLDGVLTPYAAFFKQGENMNIFFGETTEHAICVAALIAVGGIKLPNEQQHGNAEIIQFPKK